MDPSHFRSLLKKGGINVRLKSKVDKKNWIDLVVTRRPDLHPESMEIIIYTSKYFMYKSCLEVSQPASLYVEGKVRIE